MPLYKEKMHNPEVTDPHHIRTQEHVTFIINLEMFPELTLEIKNKRMIMMIISLGFTPSFLCQIYSFHNFISSIMLGLTFIVH